MFDDYAIFKKQTVKMINILAHRIKKLEGMLAVLRRKTITSNKAPSPKRTVPDVEMRANVKGGTGVWIPHSEEE